MSGSGQIRLMIVHGVPAGVGGLGIHVAQVLRALAPAAVVLSAGPADASTAHPRVITYAAPRTVPDWARRLTPLRWYNGTSQWISDRAVGVWAAMLAARERPGMVYTFTQVGFEVLEWARANGVPSILDNPNGHIADHREVSARAEAALCGGAYRGHPSKRMVRRVEREYELASRIRVVSEWARSSMVARGVPAEKIEVVPLEVDTQKYHPTERRAADGPLRLAYTSSLTLAKGFPDLLRAIREVGAENFQLIVCGKTGDRCSRRVWERESAGIELSVVENSLRAYDEAELLVSPTLHDGFGFVVAEAMSSGIPVIATDRCGASEWIREVDPQWILPAGDVPALARALANALSRRGSLVRMGKAARAAAERRSSEANPGRLVWWVLRGGRG